MTAQVLVPAAAPRTHPRLRGSARLRGAVWWALFVTSGVLTALMALALAGAARDDAAIDARPGRATADVLAVTGTRTVVQFSGPDGQVHRPAEGLAYPAGLQRGQLVRVEYDTSDPELVRTAGRTWTVGLLPAVVTAVGLWTLTLLARWWLRALWVPGGQAGGAG